MALSVNYSSPQPISDTYFVNDIYTGYYIPDTPLVFNRSVTYSHNDDDTSIYSDNEDDTSIYSDNEDDMRGCKKQLGKCAPADQQEDNTQSYQNERRWFSILMNWVRPNNSAPHVVEWKHKCVGKKQHDGNLRLRYSRNTIKCDGEDFLIFDEKKKVWVRQTEKAKQTERKLDRDKGLKEFIMGYMKNKCRDLLKVFVDCENKQRRKPHDEDEDDEDEDDGLKSSEVVPNSDNSFQRRDDVEILKSDVAEHSCEIILKKSNVPVTKDSDHKIPLKRHFKMTIIVLMVVTMFLLIGPLLGLVLKLLSQ